MRFSNGRLSAFAYLCCLLLLNVSIVEGFSPPHHHHGQQQHYGSSSSKPIAGGPGSSGLSYNHHHQHLPQQPSQSKQPPTKHHHEQHQLARKYKRSRPYEDDIVQLHNNVNENDSKSLTGSFSIPTRSTTSTRTRSTSLPAFATAKSSSSSFDLSDSDRTPPSVRAQVAKRQWRQFANANDRDRQQQQQPSTIKTATKSSQHQQQKQPKLITTVQKKPITSFYEMPQEETSLSPSSSSSSFMDTEQKVAGLTRDEEVRLSYQIRTFRAAVKVREQWIDNTTNNNSTMESLKKDGQSSIPTTCATSMEEDDDEPSETEWAEACGISVLALRRVLEEGQEARSILAAANVGLVTSIAKKHYYANKHATSAHNGVGTILGLQDLIQEGNLGLMEAAERYQPEKGFRFSTYATWWIRQRIVRSISDSSRVIRLPAHVHTMIQKMRKARQAIQEETGREATLQELSKYLDVPEEKIQLYTDSSRNVLSLESFVRTASFNNQDRRTLGEMVASDAPTPEEDAETEYMRRDVQTVMKQSLAARERDVIIQRFGLEDGKPRTLAETAQALGISLDRVRVMEARALNKLRHPQRNGLLKDYVCGDNDHHYNNNNDDDFNDDVRIFGVDGYVPRPEDLQARQDRIWF